MSFRRRQRDLDILLSFVYTQTNERKARSYEFYRNFYHLPHDCFQIIAVATQAKKKEGERER